MHRRTYHCCRLRTVVHRYRQCEKKERLKWTDGGKLTLTKKVPIQPWQPLCKEPLTTSDSANETLHWYIDLYIDLIAENHILLFFHHHFFEQTSKPISIFQNARWTWLIVSMNIQTDQTLPHAFLNLHLCKVFYFGGCGQNKRLYTPPSCVRLEAITKQLINLKQLFTVASHNSAEPSLCGGGTN